MNDIDTHNFNTLFDKRKKVLKNKTKIFYVK